MSRRAPVVALLGSMGAGKTTLAPAIASQLKCSALLESPRENPFLAGMREDPQANCMLNQSWYFAEAIDSMARAAVAGGVLDHSIVEVVAVHSPLFFRYGWLTDAEFAILQRLERSVARFAEAKPDAYIALQADPIDLIDRVAARARPEDVSPPLRYLEEVAEMRAQCLPRLGAPVVMVDTSSRDVRSPEVAVDVCEELQAMLNWGAR